MKKQTTIYAAQFYKAIRDFLQPYRRIVIHGSVNHADELGLVALFFNAVGAKHIDWEYGATAPIIGKGYRNGPELLRIDRVNKTGEDWLADREYIQDPLCLLLDCGLQLDPLMNNFDHHQYAKGLDTAMLLTNHWKELWASEEVLVEILTTLQRKIFLPISKIDTGEDRSGLDGSITQCFNMTKNHKGMTAALAWLMQLIDAAVADAPLGYIARQRVKEEVEKVGVVGILREKAIPQWEEAFIERGMHYLIRQNPQGGYSITSADAERWEVPEDSRQTFYHPSRFFAVYETLADAIAHGKELNC
ncbi:hypothetical protein [Algivirga pacifica]|uniref:Uncharacterized protein n=1 Tax=Algivirga pacifica TaxID=1162670 RepID=A0ABP9D5Z2_9BACT